MRLVTEGVEVFTTGRNFYVSWTTPLGTVHDVKPYPIVDLPGTVVLFATASAAAQVDVWPWVGPMPASMLTEAQTFQMRLCTGAKSFCPTVNFLPKNRSWTQSPSLYGRRK